MSLTFYLGSSMADVSRPPLIGIGAAVRMLRPVRAHLIACGLMSMIGAAAGLAPYVAIAEIARATLGVVPDAGTVWAWAGIGIGGAALRLVLVGLDVHVGHHADAKMLHVVRTRIVERLGVLPLGWFRRAGSGEVKKAMTGDLEDMHELFAHALSGLTSAATALAAGFTYLVLVDWRLALITIALPVLTFLMYRVAMRSMPEHTARLIAAERRISVAGVQYADGIAVAKTFGAGQGVLDRFREAVAEHAGAFRTRVREVRYSTAVNRVLASELTLLVVVLAAGLAFAGTGRLAPADVVPFLVVGVGMPTSITPMIHGAIGIRQARLAAGHIEGLLSREPLPHSSHPGQPAGHGIEMDQVTFSYDGVTNAVDGVTITCVPGTVTALVGPSGAGKSTLAGLLPRFDDVTGGAIRIGGVDVREMAPETLLGSLSLVFQDVVLLRDTVTENIRITRPEAGDDEVRQAAKAAQIHDVIERLPYGYDTVLGTTDGGDLSGGERQRLTIARAIISDAPIVVLDEATAALDPDGEAAVQDALSELIAGKTVLVIAHRLHTIRDADQIVVLDQGRIAERGTHQDLLTRDGLYARMWRAQQNGATA